MNEKHMQYVLTVLKEGSFTGAARKLYVSQPSLSQIIKAAEANLGAPIFNRSTDPITLTPAGALYVKAAKQISTISTNLAKQVEELSNEEFGKIRLGISVQRGMELLPYLYPRFKSRFPHVELELHEQGSATMEESVLEGSVGIALLTTFPKYDELVYDLIQKENMVLLVNKACALAERIRPGTPIDIREAADEVFICSRQGHSARTILDALCAARNMKPEIGLETISIEVGKYVVATSPVVMACPDAYADTENSLLSPYYTYPILGVENPRHFFACYRKDLYLTKYMRYLLELLHEVRNLPAGRHGQTPGAEAQSLIGIPTELPQMLNAREQRAALQNSLLVSCRCPLVSFSLNIPGPVKVLPLVPEAFDAGISKIEDALADQGLPVVRREQVIQATGLEAMWAVETAGAVRLKTLMAAIEDGGGLGRLFDIDVLDAGGKKLSREDLGLPPRKCLLCEQPAHACARSRTHTVMELTEQIESILRKEFSHHGI